MVAAVCFSGMVAVTSCNKGATKNGDAGVVGRESVPVTTEHESSTGGKGGTYQTLENVYTVADIRTYQDGSAVEVMFSENTQFFTVADAATLEFLKEALSKNEPVAVTFDPWQGVIVKAQYPDAQEAQAIKSRKVVSDRSHAMELDLSRISDDVINTPEDMGVLNTTDAGLTNVIPDFATAQMMFDYITRQCCALPGPYAIDYCITFQYCPDGCYARAHKMCWIINNKYNYGTKKIFSFANSGSDKLCVQAQKWGGCCIRWWYHVAPLVTIKTPTGPKAYVFDPAMFNQPVLLSTWLHFQENPVCAASFTPHVSMINVQPTSSYAPSGSSGFVFSTDPTYSRTNSTLTSYKYRISCP